ncbi:unnamed protein product [Microthlaspi erraticum]|uniref:Cyclin-D1-binding protein 1-like C-terminal domain-containing protein n=1 Tax=Microthlaspi erraticum TaxID=1685480 RepID=A0A6D2KRA9_9BRAS|nr:unnamed protein product [Microthlaspi erraticum]
MNESSQLVMITTQMMVMRMRTMILSSSELSPPGMMKMENAKDESGFVDSLEKLLKQCQGTGAHIDELGACVYPPQEISKMKQAVEVIEGNVDEFEAEVERLQSSSDAFSGACGKLRRSIKHMETELDKRCEDEVVVEMQNVTLGSYKSLDFFAIFL